MNLLDLPYELRYMIYREAIRVEQSQGRLGSTQWIGYCDALELRFNAWFDFSKP